MAKILIADDQPCVQELLSEELISEGHRVVTAGDAESVRGHVRSSRPDLVLLDLYLDGFDGIGVLRDIKRQHPDLPVIIFTAYDSYVEDPRVSQADAYVIKNIVLDELKAKIADVVSRRPSPRKEVETKTYFPQFSAAQGS